MTARKKQRLEAQLRSFFGLRSIPFTKSIDDAGTFDSPQISKALERLRYLSDRRGIGAVFGAPGTGKSTLLRTFLDSLGKTTHSVCYVTHTTCATVDLFREIARGFQIEPPYRKVDVLRDLKERILKISRNQRLNPVLVIDEAHLLPRSFLDDLRILTSFDGDGRNELTLVIAGQPQLETNLRLAVNEALAQRIVIRVRLRSLHPNEVEAYLEHRLQSAGRTAKLFLPDAIEALAAGSRGILRLLDRIAEQSLLLALEKGAKEIDAETVTEAIDEVEP